MCTVGLEGIDHTVQLTHAWINELDALVGWDSKARSYRLLRAVIQALRDWRPVNDAAHLGAQLAMLLRGIYCEHWRPAITPVSNRHRENFLAHVDEAFQADPILFTSEAVSAVFELLTDKIATGEIEKVRHSLPADLRALWPASSKAA
jgi:uncharacterized protein (DUF2267 family)